MGSIDYDGANFMAQRLLGSRVSLRERHPAINFEELGNGLYDVHSFNWPTNPPVNAQGNIPPFAEDVEGVFRSSIPGGSGQVMSMDIQDDEALGVDSNKKRREVNDSGGIPDVYWVFRLSTNTTVSFTAFPNPQGIATGISNWRTLSYIDPILASR